MKKLTLSRRTVLRGMVGGTTVALGLPLLEAMLDSTGTALADGGALPCRFVTFMFGNGVRLDRWTPAVTGPDWALTEELAPLQNVRERCTVVSGFEHRLPGANGHTNGLFGSFAGHAGEYYDPENLLMSRPSGPSIDQVVADAVGPSTYLSSIQLGNSKRTPPDGGGSMSFRGPNEINPPYFDPTEAYQRLFVGPGESDTLRARILDAVLDDAAHLRQGLGQSDRSRLDAHLDGIADLEERMLSVPPPCDAPPTPTETNEDTGGQEPLVEVAEAMADVLVAAFRCDLVRVASMQQSGSVCQSIYTMTGATIDNHSVTHEGTTNARELTHQAVVVNMEAFAYLLEAMHAEPEGAGTMLDNSVVLLGSDVAEGQSHSSFDMPFVVAGGAGGQLRMGRHLREPGRNASDLLLTCVRAVAPGVESIGSGPGFSDQTVGALEV